MKKKKLSSNENSIWFDFKFCYCKMKWNHSNEISEILTESIKLSDNMLSAHEHAELGFCEDFESSL